MDFLYPFFVSFFLIFLSELGDKTQLLVLSFSSKLKSYTILFGVALGSFFSHGIAILFGSTIGNLQNPFFHQLFTFLTYISFVFFGIFTLLKKEDTTSDSSHKNGFLHTISKLPIGYILIIAFCIATGELGDKTFLASLGLGISYSNFKLFLILGAILGMVASDFIAVLTGKFLSHKVSPTIINILSGILFLIFGFIRISWFFCGIYLMYKYCIAYICFCVYNNEYKNKYKEIIYD